MTLTAADRETIEFNRATFEKMTAKGLSDLLSEQKVPGRSKAKTRAKKIELLMAQTWGYQDFPSETSQEPNPQPGEPGYHCPYCNDPEYADMRTETYRCYICNPEIPEEKAEDSATSEAIRLDPSAVCESLSSWICTKTLNPRAIVMVEDANDPRCATTYAGDAMLLNRLFHTELFQTYFDGDRAIAQCRISRGSTSAFALRLKDKGFELVKNY